MEDDDHRQFKEGERRRHERAVAAFVSEIESMRGRWENVAPGYIIESTLLELCTELSVLAPDIKIVAGPATLKLRDALAEYRGSASEDG